MEDTYHNVELSMCTLLLWSLELGLMGMKRRSSTAAPGATKYFAPVGTFHSGSSFEGMCGEAAFEVAKQPLYSPAWCIPGCALTSDCLDLCSYPPGEPLNAHWQPAATKPIGSTPKYCKAGRTSCETGWNTGTCSDVCRKGGYNDAPGSCCGATTVDTGSNLISGSWVQLELNYQNCWSTSDRGTYPFPESWLTSCGDIAELWKHHQAFSTSPEGFQSWDCTRVSDEERCNSVIIAKNGAMLQLCKWVAHS